MTQPVPFELAFSRPASPERWPGRLDHLPEHLGNRIDIPPRGAVAMMLRWLNRSVCDQKPKLMFDWLVAALTATDCVAPDAASASTVYCDATPAAADSATGSVPA